MIIGHASRANVTVDVTASDLALTVADNGVGVAAGEQGRRSGLHNIDERAARLGGTAELEIPPGGGTLVRWQIPLSNGPVKSHGGIQAGGQAPLRRASPASTRSRYRQATPTCCPAAPGLMGPQPR
ncbi:hypothetical protein ETD86_12290 [Nonomuraea turkmeniaca]|uniref:Histidine kinase/HSP90-like ATPase domain-containing protein n=1 Tax=Nonomuraea turkmeniaca TaxID=103838 RepID=A0A5S4FNI2_9ACTN|nr:ATP-binding protein [Nonomuraea turkmeniaca]TMR22218.1 hypothetical protein ETD86_12290 [Nonomuraea turkmeniaca]